MNTLRVSEFNLNFPSMESEQHFIDVIYSILTIASLNDIHPWHSNVDQDSTGYIAFQFYDKFVSNNYNFNLIFELKLNFTLDYIKIFNHLTGKGISYSLSDCDKMYNDFTKLIA